MRSPPPRPLLAVALSLAAFGGACGGSGDGGAKPTPRPVRDASLQPSGSYLYATRGFEQLAAVVSSRHGYPKTSVVHVADNACGFSERWQPRPERWAEWRYCVRGKRWRVQTQLDYHEFFGQAVQQRFTCTGPYVPRPTVVKTGFTWTDRCRGAGSRVAVRYRAVRNQTLAVQGKPVETVLVQARAALNGRIRGVNVLDSWLSRKNGLLVRRAVTSATSIASPFGKLHDRERYSLKIRSLTPR
jgi:hypothetical protein